MGLGWPFSERRGAEEPHGIAETRGGQRQRPIWARGRHAKPGLKEPRTLILRQPPRLSWCNGDRMPRVGCVLQRDGMVETVHEATTPPRTGGPRQRSGKLSTRAGE